MHKIHTMLLSAFLGLLAFPLFSSAEVIDRIVAEVNGDIITLSELNEHGKPFYQNIMANAPANIVEDEIQKARTEILDRLIEEKLIEQESEKFGISILESEVDTAIASIIADNKISAEQFSQELQRMGTDEKSYRANIKNQILKSRMINIEVRSKLVITNERIQEYYDTYYQNQSAAPEGYHIMQIGFAWGEKYNSKSQEEARATAEMVKNRISQGEEFSALAKQYSDLPSAEDGGDIGTFNKAEMAQYMLDAIKDVRPGGTSSIIETPTGFQILRLVSANLGGTVTQAPIDSVRNEIQEAIYKQEMEKGYEKWMSDIREKAYIKKNL